MWNTAKAELNLGQSMGCKQLVINKMAPGTNGGIQEVNRKQVNTIRSSMHFLVMSM